MGPSRTAVEKPAGEAVSRRPTVTGPQHIERAQRLAEILQLRLAGNTLQAIGESLTPQITAQAVHKCIKRALETMVDEAVEQARQLEAMRCYELTNAVFEKALNGDLPAIDRTLQIMARRSRLLGLDAQPLRRPQRIGEGCSTAWRASSRPITNCRASGPTISAGRLLCSIISSSNCWRPRRLKASGQASTICRRLGR